MQAHPLAERLQASLRRLHAAQARAARLGDYVQALLVHVNEAAAALRDPADPPRGRVFRIGLAFVTEDGLVVPMPFRRESPALFIDQFHVMPLAATSLGPLLERGRGDRIDDLEAHLRRRGVSLSSQAALREGVRSNVRLPWSSLDRRGFIWFSADVPRFFDDALFAHLESLVPEVELQLRLLDALEPVLPAGAARPLPLEGSVAGLGQLRRLLEVEENPCPGRLALEWRPVAGGTGAGLINLWRLGAERVLLCAIACRDERACTLRLVLMLRGWVLQAATTAVNPSRILEGVEARLAEAREAGSVEKEAQPAALSLAVLHLGTGQVDHAGAGAAQLWLADEEGERPLDADPRPLGAASGRSAGCLGLVPGARLLVRQADEMRLGIRLLIGS